MSSILRKILSNATARILILVFGAIIGITVYFLATGYYTQLKLYEEGEVRKLSGIANTLSNQIDGDAHEILYRQYPLKDQLTTVHSDMVYKEFHDILRKAYITNGLETPIYTMVYVPEEDIFHFVIHSDSIYWRHPWEKFSPIHVQQYEKGGVILPYEDENGTWLSAFAPIKDHNGKVVAAVQVDSKFDVFIHKTRKEIGIRAAISIFLISLLGFFLFRSIRSILAKEEQLTREIIESHAIIEAKNKDITDSIQYAKRIQEAILPSITHIRKELNDSFVLFLPRDIVSGDFYWYTEIKDRVFIAAVDCTGHGVPGAFMSMIGNTLLNEIINQKEIYDPGKILDTLDEGIKVALRQREDDRETRDGMDLALVSFCKHFKDLKFSGAFRPLIHIRDEELSEIKANRFPIGGGSAYEKTKFTTTTVDLQPGDLIYLFSDGYPDQIGGDKDKKFMTKRFKDLIMQHRHLPMAEQEQYFRNALADWQGEHEQMDDILVIGIRVPKV